MTWRQFESWPTALPCWSTAGPFLLARPKKSGITPKFRNALTELRVLKFLTGPLGLPEEAKTTWIRHWIDTGLSAREAQLSRLSRRGKFCLGDMPTLADICPVPQLFNAQRFNVELSAYPTLQAIDAECRKLPTFQDAHPARQPDSE
jgi:maleylpyruvate isomerase